MILFIMLVLTLFILAGFTIVAVSIGGAAVIIMFGDVIICIVLIVWLLRFLTKKWRR